MDPEVMGASDIASSAFGAGEASQMGASAGPMAITQDPGSFSSPLPNQPATGATGGGKDIIKDLAKNISSGSKANNTSFNVSMPSSPYQALFSTPARSASAPIAPIQMPQMPAAQVQAAPAPAAVPMQAPMPAPQLAMSDINAKKNIRPIRQDIDMFLSKVYNNVIAKKRK